MVIYSCYFSKWISYTEFDSPKPQPPFELMKDKILVLGSTNIGRVIESALGTTFGVTTLPINNGFDGMQARHMLLSEPNIRKVFVVPNNGQLCDGLKTVIADAQKRRKPCTVLADAGCSASGSLRDQSERVGANFVSGDIDRETIVALATSSVAQASHLPHVTH